MTFTDLHGSPQLYPRHPTDHEPGCHEAQHGMDDTRIIVQAPDQPEDELMARGIATEAKKVS